MHHFIKNPHSLIVKVLGAYKIQIDKKKPVHFVVLQSVFYPATALSARYDIKGCLAGRYQRPGHLSPQSEVFKDQNFVREGLKLGSSKLWFIKQIERDIHFLRCHNIVDYSLLVGIQAMENSESHANEANNITETEDKPRKSSENRKLSANERQTFWSSLVKQIDDLGNVESHAETMRMDSRLSNMSALVELLGEGSPIDSPTRSSQNSSVKVLFT